jgi:hypothetical protein
VSAAPEEFELERPYEAPPLRWVSPEPAPPSPVAERPAPPVEPVTEFEFEGAPQAPPAAPPPDLTSPTLAELYFNQGFTDKAIEVYRQILERDRGNLQAQSRLGELQALAQAREAPAANQPGVEAAAAPATPERRQAIERTIQRLEGFLAAIRRE